MLRTQQRRQVNRGQQAVSRPLPPPVMGWNAKDSLDAMKPADAVILENWFPEETRVTVRYGSAIHCNTGEGTFNVETVAEWKAGASRKLVVGCHGKLIDATTSTPSTLGSGFTSNRWRHVNFGERLFLVNGADAPQDYNGSALAATAWSGSGLTITTLSDAAVFKERLWFIEKDTLNAWYAALQTITGTLVKFPLKYTGSFGGTLKAIGTLTVDGGTGPDDLILFFLSSGEVIVYGGSDPADATDFHRVGTFLIGPPVGNAPLLQFGNDLLAITESAYTPITRVAATRRTEGKSSDIDLSDRISGAVSAAVKAYKDNTGWQAVFFPSGSKLIVNVPRSAVAFDQHVMNLSTKAWCKFTGWNFPCFGVFSNELYAGGTDGKVYQCDTGTSDNATAIVADGQTAWNYFGDTGREKNFTMARVIFAAASDPTATMSIGTDFVISVPTDAVEVGDVDSGAIWDTAIWDTALWAGATQTFQGWQGVSGQGYAASMRLRVAVTEQTPSWMAGNIVFKPAGMV